GQRMGTRASPKNSAHICMPRDVDQFKSDLHSTRARRAVLISLTNKSAALRWLAAAGACTPAVVHLGCACARRKVKREGRMRLLVLVEAGGDGLLEGIGFERAAAARVAGRHSSRRCGRRLALRAWPGPLARLRRGAAARAAFLTPLQLSQELLCARAACRCA